MVSAPIYLHDLAHFLCLLLNFYYSLLEYFCTLNVGYSPSISHSLSICPSIKHTTPNHSRSCWWLRSLEIKFFFIHWSTLLFNQEMPLSWFHILSLVQSQVQHLKVYEVSCISEEKVNEFTRVGMSALERYVSYLCAFLFPKPKYVLKGLISWVVLGQG